MAEDQKDPKWTRRRFIQQGGSFALGSLALMSGACGDPDPKKAPKDMAPDLSSDMASDMSDMQDMSPDQSDMEDMAALAVISKSPFVQMLGATSARLRFETPGDQALDVRVEQVSGAMGMDFKPTLETQDVQFAWPSIGSSFRKKVDIHDDPGIYSMQQVTLENLKPGERYRWHVHLGDGVARTGEFVMAKAKEDTAVMGWISDTMHPFVKGSVKQLLDLKSDFIVHGGDFQYMTNPLDTWNGMFRAFGDVMASAPMHWCIGNHEYEALDEFNVQFKRIFGQQHPSGTLDYHTFDYGPARMLLLNSEIDMIDPNGAQWIWLNMQLDKAKQDGMIPIVAFHRPYFTFSRSKPSFEVRDKLHPLFVQHKVPIVFTGHNHCYERFEVDDMVYIMDGGGGALGYRIDHNKEEVLDQRPTDEPLRKNASETYGAGSLEIRPDGTMRYKRISDEGAVIDDLTLG